ncbi:hypothetical protein HK100_003627 [Physocladia obscura]|uniref:Uncharacterized protein n=1 Tax=Physocladia obscura TaxID=109957 RepID=A0AAD5TCM1_9FUNG|nr:hypothetical protein HK100_003627 [Physocladia obscura]
MNGSLNTNIAQLKRLREVLTTASTHADKSANATNGSTYEGVSFVLEMAAPLESRAKPGSASPPSLAPVAELRLRIRGVGSGVEHALTSVCGVAPLLVVTRDHNDSNNNPSRRVGAVCRVVPVGPASFGHLNFASGHASVSAYPNFVAILPAPTTSLSDSVCAVRLPLSPLPIEHARLDLPVTSRLAQIIRPIFVFCESQSSQFSYLGLHLPRSQSGQMPSIFSIQDCGFTSLDSQLPFTPASIIHDFIRDYNPIQNGKQIVPLTQAYAKYHLLESIAPNTSSISLEVTWNTVQKLLSHPTFATSMILTISYISGFFDHESHTTSQSLRVELEKLMALQSCKTLPANDDLDQFWDFQFNINAETRTDANDEKKKSGPSSFLFDSINLFLDEIRYNDLESQATVRNTRAATNTDESILRLENILPERTDFDFTDKLWIFCLGAKSFQDLNNVTLKIAQELTSGSLQPMVAKTNNTRLATLVRNCLRFSRMQTSTDYLQRQDAILREAQDWTENPLEYLIEVGAHKLRRDYCFHFISMNLAGWKDLEPFTSSTTSIETQITNLKIFHKTLEVWSLAESNVPSFPHVSARALVNAALESFSTTKDEDYHDIVLIDKTKLGVDYANGGHSNIAAVKFVMALPKFQAESAKLVESVSQIYDPAVWRLALYPPKRDSGIGSFDGSGSTEIVGFEHDVIHLVQFSTTNELFPSGDEGGKIFGYFIC